MLLLFLRRFRRDPRWRSLSVLTLVWAVTAAAAFVFVIINAEGELFGVTQKIYIAVWVSWYLPVVAYLLRAD